MSAKAETLTRTPAAVKLAASARSGEAKAHGHDFKTGDHVVYPAHGVGVVQGVETTEIAGAALELYVIAFDHEKMTLRVPTRKATTHGLRALAAGNVIRQAAE